MFGPTRENGATKGVNVDQKEGRIHGPCLGHAKVRNQKIYFREEGTFQPKTGNQDSIPPLSLLNLHKGSSGLFKRAG